MSTNKTGETLFTRSAIADARQRILEDEALSDREKVERLIEMLERAKRAVASERQQTANPQTKMDKITAAFNNMCVDPEIPLEEEIDQVIAKLRVVLDENE